MASTARLKFLDEAADLLAFSSPTIAAQLRSTRLDSTQENESKSLKAGGVCGGCGESLIAGWNCFIKTKKRTRQERLEQDRGTKGMTVQCNRCNSFTTIQHARRCGDQPSPQQPLVKTPPESKKVVAVQAQDQPPQRSITPPSSTNETGVKKRSRHKKSSLQSLLAERKTMEPKKGLGLDLMDFIKT